MDYELATRYREEILATLGVPGRMISGSRTGYRDRHPDHLLVFNATVCAGPCKIWDGDLDLTLDEPTLLELAERTGQVIHVLHESDGRFTYKDQPRIDEAVFSAAATGHTSFDPAQAVRGTDGRLYVRRYPRLPRWSRPARPRLWRFWKLSSHTERSRNPDGMQVSRLLRVGRRGSPQPTPLLVLGVHTSPEARDVWVEWVWYPTGRRAWAPSISGQMRRHHGQIRPYASLRLTPGLAHEIRLGAERAPSRRGERVAAGGTDPKE